MRAEDYVSPSAGEVRRLPSGYLAFIPTPPPFMLHYNSLVRDLSAADAALGELAGVTRILPNPHLLIRSSVRREATASTKIEGTQADLEDLYVDELFAGRTDPSGDVAEIRNYVAALEFGRAKLAELPIAGRLVREVHAVLLADVRGREKRPGEFRTSQNWIGGRGPSDATYVPPPPDELWRCFGEWERFVNMRDAMPDLIQCGLMHEYFEAIHPFLDGNGRVGRLLMTLFLLERGRLSEPVFYVSTYIERNRAAYHSALQRTRTHGDRIGWLRYFLEAVRESSTVAVRDTVALLTLREALRAKLSAAKKTNRLSLIDSLFENPYLTVQRAKSALGVATDTAAKAIGALESLGILREVTGKSYGRLWVAEPILNALKGQTSSDRS